MIAVRSSSTDPSIAAPSRTTQGRSWSRTTPGWLRLTSVSLAVLIVAAALLAVFVTASRQAATNHARTTTGGALIQAQTIATSLSDADRAVAGTFLTTDATAKAALYQRYRQDLARATTSLAQVSGQAGGDPAARGPLRTLTTDIPAYAGVVETARTNDRLGNPVASAYLGEANNLLTSSILPAANLLYESQRQQLADAYDNARRWPLAVVAALLLVAVVVAMVRLQWRMSRRFRRTLNLPLLGATVLVLVVLVWFAIALVAQGSAIDRAESQGSDPVSALTQASILAQQLRADDELTLVTRDAVPAYQQDYQKVSGQLGSLLQDHAGSSSSYQALREAAPLVAQLDALHQQVRTQDAAKGDLTGAIALDAGAGRTDVPAVADRLDAVLNTGITGTGSHFASVAADARDDLTGLVVGLLVLGAVAAALVLLGAQRRIEEYR